MAADYCKKRLRIHMPGLLDENLQTLTRSLLSMVRGVHTVTLSPISQRVLIIYDDRLVEAGQLTALTGHLCERQHALTPATTYTQNRAKTVVALPLLLLTATGLRRLVFGRSPATQSIVLFEVATALSVFSGYPQLRSRVRALARRLHISDDALLTSAALVLAVLRESPLVFLSLFTLSYSAFKKRDNVIAAAARAGESVADLTSENLEPTPVARYGQYSGRVGAVIAVLTAFMRQDPLQASAVLLAANPRPAVVGARYTLNYGEILTHEECAYIPLHTGMDLYELADAQEVVCLHARSDRFQTPAAHGLYVHSHHIREFTEAPPAQGKKRNCERPLRRVVLLDATVEMPACHQRQGDTLYLRGDMAALLRTRALSQSLRTHIKFTTQLTAVFNLIAVTAVIALKQTRTINVASDLFTLLVLALPNQLRRQANLTLRA
ncbi:MAG: hypothetical protein OWT28_00990 [Firmicutes bacterium]|nr:hypothetical protein [Bacillota bacterium]